MIKKILTILFLITLTCVFSVRAEIQASCQNFPPPSFCPNGISDVIITGTDNNGCAIYGCRSPQTPSISVISPNGGEVWQIGGDYNIEWKSTNVTNANIDLQFSDGFMCPLDTLNASLGHYKFHFNGGIRCPGDRGIISGPGVQLYKIMIFGDSESVNDSSDNSFQIAFTENQPTITVVSPNGGEQWEVGKNYDLSWNTVDYDPHGLVDLQLCDTKILPGTKLCAEIIQGVIPNSGKYSWTIPPRLVGLTLKGYKIYQIEARIFPEGKARWAEIDFSDNNFSISPSGSEESQVYSKTCPAGCICDVDNVTCPREQRPINTTEKINVTESKNVINDSYNYSQKMRVTPEQLSNILRTISTEKTDLIEESGKAIYSVSGTKRGKVLLVFPVRMNVLAKVDAETGEIISLKKPWWSFFVKEE